jgi:hypothetical protein
VYWIVDDCISGKERATQQRSAVRALGAACCKALLPVITFLSPEAPNVKIRPLYDRVVVKRVEEASAMQGGLHIPDSAKEKPQEGEVAAADRDL